MAAVVCETVVNTPFGDGQPTGGSCSDASPMHFTGKQRDTETNLDDFGARYFTSTMGRWVTPDWSARPSAAQYADLGNPQSLNLYAYVNNNPVTHVDADGHAVEAANNFAQGMEMQGDSSASDELDGLDAEDSAGQNADAEGDAELVAQGETASDAPPDQGVDTDRLGTSSADGAQQQNSDQQNTSKLDKDKFVNYMDQNAKNKSTGFCAMACRKGLAAGGLNTSGHPADAKDYGPFLVKNGASVVPNKGYKPEKGDIVVFEGNKSHPYGHIEVYNGKGWVSDFKQHSMIPYRSDVPPHTVYRFPDDQ